MSTIKRKYFGTDGVRGVANAELSPQLAMAIGAAAACVLRKHNPHSREMIIGRDPRISGDVLGAGLVAGLLSQGINTTVIGTVPTPGVAYLTHLRGAIAGVVLSASHNPVADNGIKFFAPDGRKLPDSVEAEIEAAMENWEAMPRPVGAEVGRITRTTEPVDAYVDYLVESVAPVRLDGMTIVADCANGAAFTVALRVLERLGATVVPLACTPDGININENCGSTHPEGMARKVVEVGADAGLAFDGDADRVILADANGNIFDGDHILCTLGIWLKQNGRLTANTVVGTVMSNLGLEQAFAKHQIQLVRAKVGDRYVSEEMVKSGAVVGGEQSGHILLTELSTTGDGVLTGLQILKVCKESGRSLSEWRGEMEKLPQKLTNIVVRERDGWDVNPQILEAIHAVENDLAGRGRLLVRPSGTEKLIRVMVEAPTQAEVESMVERVAGVVRREIGA